MINRVVAGMMLLSLVACQSPTAPAVAADKVVEIRLVNDVDESRGYCLDIAGGRGARAPLDKGLQAHTCYDYTGGLLEDQSFDAALIEQGKFKLPYFSVCMTAASLEAASALALAPCDNTAAQQFSLQPSGRLVLHSDSDLCVTVSSTEKREGRGGTPVHVMRPLTLMACSEDQQQYQAWTLFSL